MKITQTKLKAIAAITALSRRDDFKNIVRHDGIPYAVCGYMAVQLPSVYNELAVDVDTTVFNVIDPILNKNVDELIEVTPITLQELKEIQKERKAQAKTENKSYKQSNLHILQLRNKEKTAEIFINIDYPIKIFTVNGNGKLYMQDPFTHSPLTYKQLIIHHDNGCKSLLLGITP